MYYIHTTILLAHLSLSLFQLEILDLGGNLLGQVGNDAFLGLGKLRSLSLDGNDLSGLATEFESEKKSPSRGGMSKDALLPLRYASS